MIKSQVNKKYSEANNKQNALRPFALTVIRKKSIRKLSFNYPNKFLSFYVNEKVVPSKHKSSL